ncbi:MAG: class I SAM-dependent methyltransferase [Gammaproteobacteria bacterium]
MPNPESMYDSQAAVFEQRAGLRASTCQALVRRIAAVSAASQNKAILEIGCGTGQLGVLLSSVFGYYTGIDVSTQMLRQFERRAVAGAFTLKQADGNDPWPVADHSVDVVFVSRAAHWLDIEHSVREAHRVINSVSSQSGLFIIGRVERPADSWESRLRRHCHDLLRRYQQCPRVGEQHLHLLQQAFRMAGDVCLAPELCYRWIMSRSVSSALSDWERKPGLAGLLLDDAVKRTVLMQLQRWCRDAFQDAMPTEAERCYVLYPVLLG